VFLVPPLALAFVTLAASDVKSPVLALARFRNRSRNIPENLVQRQVVTNRTLPKMESLKKHHKTDKGTHFPGLVLPIFLEPTKSLLQSDIYLSQRQLPLGTSMDGQLD
jgi:hypothetical protein